MSEKVRVRLILARLDSDTEPSVVAAVDDVIWEHWDDGDEARWREDAEQLWGMAPARSTYREVWAEFSPDDLRAAFEEPVVQGDVLAGKDTSA